MTEGYTTYIFSGECENCGSHVQESYVRSQFKTNPIPMRLTTQCRDCREIISIKFLTLTQNPITYGAKAKSSGAIKGSPKRVKTPAAKRRVDDKKA